MQAGSLAMLEEGSPRESQGGLPLLLPLQGQLPPSFNPALWGEIICPREDSLPGRRTAETMSWSPCQVGPHPTPPKLGQNC